MPSTPLIQSHTNILIHDDQYPSPNTVEELRVFCHGLLIRVLEENNAEEDSETKMEVVTSSPGSYSLDAFSSRHERAGLRCSRDRRR